MKLEQLLLIRDEIINDHDISSITSECEVYYLFQEKWYDTMRVQVDDQALIFRLARGKSSLVPTHARSSNIAFFSVAEYEGVARITFKNRPAWVTLQRTNDRIEECIKRAQHTYHATHDSLTGLINGRRFEGCFELILEETTMSGPLDSSHVADAQTAPVVALVTIDIDHFKQVNDSYGHDYGDVVLRSFARRIESHIQKIADENSSVRNAFIGRCGGEEFRIGIAGLLTPDGIKELADQVRNEICFRELPTEDEWRSIPPSDIPSSLQMPLSSERHITASLGISSIASLTGDMTPKVLMKQLESEADSALYRAKVGGRNVVRYFPDIKEKYGTVLEHHKDTNVVTIDIGSNVRVNAGDEFLVYHPDFCGNRGFIFSDGRTHRRLGIYPRQHSGRVQAKEVQREISFCETSENDMTGLFPAGSMLEYVPIGSITHLLKSQSDLPFSGPILHVPAAIKNFVEASQSSGTKPCVAVLFVNNQAELVQARGSSFVNYSLATIVECLRETFGAQSVISQVQPSSIAIAVSGQPVEVVTSLLEQTADIVGARTHDLARIAIAAFSEDKYVHFEGDESKINTRYALDYALYARNVYGEGPKIQFFNSATPNNVLYALRRNKRFADASAEYQKMKQMGMSSANIENQNALIAYEMPNRNLDDALTSVKEAIRLKPSVAIFRANLGLIEAAKGEWIDAAQAFESVGEYELSDVYKFPRAWSAYVKYKETGTTFLNVETIASSLEGLFETDCKHCI